MPPLRLPNELLEAIFDHIHDKTDRPTRALESQKTFASLARTSKLFLPLARSRLYYRSISPFAPVSWLKALQLVAALSTPLDELVVSLEGIVDFVGEIGDIDEPSTPLPFQLRGYTKAFSLYHKLLSCCPRLLSVEIICNSKKHLAKLLDALKNSLSTLKTVKFANSAYSNEYRISEDIIHEALHRLRPGNVDEVILYDVDVSELSGDPHGPLALRSFSIQWSQIGVLQHYQRLTRTSLPPSEFARFTSLTHVSLHSFDGPSLALLNTLVTSSPDIRLLDFYNSRWVNPSSSTSTSFPIVDNSISSLLDPQALLDHLLRFERLESVHLGYLPTRKRDTFRVLKEELEEERGIEVEWYVCR
ncbi:hypothetical protein JCM5350_005538 [Sporobolomyces pararoseus]